MGKCYEEGKGVPTDLSKAVTWFKLAAKGNTEYPNGGTSLPVYASFSSAASFFLVVARGELARGEHLEISNRPTKHKPKRNHKHEHRHKENNNKITLSLVLSLARVLSLSLPLNTRRVRPRPRASLEWNGSGSAPADVGRTGFRECSYLRLVDFCITQL